MKKIRKKANNCKIDAVLYDFYLTLKARLGAAMVHRRGRKSNSCIEIVFRNEVIVSLTGRLNSLKEAEACGYWVMCRRQNKRGHANYRGRVVYQLFLTPVHPKKRFEAKFAAAPTAVDVSFEPIVTKPMYENRHHSRLLRTQKCKFICTYKKNVVSLQRFSKILS